MSFWRDLLVDIKSMAVLHDDVQRLEKRVDKIDDRVVSHGERLANIEGLINWIRPSPRLPS
jgi:hypothetical protein